MVDLEKNEAKRMGAKLHPNSGRGPVKGDATWGNFIVDFKHFKKSFSISKDVWAKICTDAMRVDKSKDPMLMLVLGETDKVRLAVISIDTLQELIDGV